MIKYVLYILGSYAIWVFGVIFCIIAYRQWDTVSVFLAGFGLGCMKMGWNMAHRPPG